MGVDLRMIRMLDLEQSLRNRVSFSKANRPLAESRWQVEQELKH
jgi:hypothetical protein